MSGKGSKPRPYSVDRKTFDDNWDRIFKNEYQDVLSTEDAVLDALKNNADTNTTIKSNSAESTTNNSR